LKAVIQRVAHACVTVDGAQTGYIGSGLLVMLGVSKTDGCKQAQKIAKKVASLRIFDDEQGKLNKSVGEIGGGVLVISNFTLYADCRKGRRPDFSKAASFDTAFKRYNDFISALMAAGVENIQTGRFGADMKVELLNDGPVTVVIDSEELA